MPELGTVITSARRIGPRQVEVLFRSAHAGSLHQLYAGRTLIGVTDAATDRAVRGPVPIEKTPCPLQVVAVDPANRLTDFGSLLPLHRAYNRFTLRWQAADMPADTDRFSVLSPPGIDAAPDRIIGAAEYHRDGEYRLPLPTLDQSGQWTFGVVPRDDASGPDFDSEGNAGPMVTVSLRASVMPPDLRYESGRRFSVSAEDGVATIAWQPLEVLA